MENEQIKIRISIMQINLLKPNLKRFYNYKFHT